MRINIFIKNSIMIFLSIWVCLFYFVDMAMGWLASGSHGRYKSYINAKLGTNFQRIMSIIEVGITSFILSIVLYVIVT